MRPSTGYSWFCVLTIKIVFSGDAKAAARCANGLVTVPRNGRCCTAITCLKGHEAVTCKRDDPLSSSCKLCSHDKFRQDISVLGANDLCHYKKVCRDDEMITSCGSSSQDATCDCKPGSHYNKEQTVCLKDRTDAYMTQTASIPSEVTIQSIVTPEPKQWNHVSSIVPWIVVVLLIIGFTLRETVLCKRWENFKLKTIRRCRGIESCNEQGHSTNLNETQTLNGLRRTESSNEQGQSDHLLETHTQNEFSGTESSNGQGQRDDLLENQPQEGLNHEGLVRILIDYCDKNETSNKSELDECGEILGNLLRNKTQLDEFRTNLIAGTNISNEDFTPVQDDLKEEISKTVRVYKEKMGDRSKFSAIVDALKPQKDIQIKLVTETCNLKSYENLSSD